MQCRKSYRQNFSEATIQRPTETGLQGITAAQSVFGSATPHVAVFDTAFHQSMPPKAFMYGLPYDLYENHAIRR
jgi:acetate kinase